MGQNASHEHKAAATPSATNHTPPGGESRGAPSGPKSSSGTAKPGASQTGSEGGSPEEVAKFDLAVSHGVLQLGIDLVREMRRSSVDGNLVLSPYAVASDLEELLVGARGDTAAQISAALHLPPGHTVTAYFADRDRDIPNRRRSDPQHRFDMGYVNNVHHDHKMSAMDPQYRGAEDALRLVRFSWDFANQADRSCEEIDQYACLYTYAFEPSEIMPIGSITPSYQVCLVSAVDFRGSWQYKFDEQTATLESFHASDGSSSDVVMLHQTGHFSMASCGELKATALQLPYQAPCSSGSATEVPTPVDGAPATHHGSVFSLVILLPDEVDGLANVEEKLDATNAMHCFSQLKPVGTVRVGLPLFKVKQVGELVPALSSLGVCDVFTERAELWGSTAGQKRVSAIRHAAAFETAPSGGRHRSRPKSSRATLAQGLTSLVKAPPHSPHSGRDFVVDRPFVFFVICSNPDTLMLLGSVRKIIW